MSVRRLSSGDLVAVRPVRSHTPNSQRTSTSARSLRVHRDPAEWGITPLTGLGLVAHPARDLLASGWGPKPRSRQVHSRHGQSARALQALHGSRRDARVRSKALSADPSEGVRGSSPRVGFPNVLHTSQVRDVPTSQVGVEGPGWSPMGPFGSPGRTVPGAVETPPHRLRMRRQRPEVPDRFCSRRCRNLRINCI
jgi:hypothetical protein